MAKEVLRVTLWCLVLIMIGLLLSFSFFAFPTFLYVYEPIPVGSYRIVVIPAKSGVFEVAKQLKNEGIVKDPYKFLVVVYIMGWEGKLKSGEYGFKSMMSHGDVIGKIVRGDVLRHIVLVVEGATLRDVAQEVEKAGLSKKEEVLKLSKDPDFIKSVGLDVATLEGYLFPATYSFTLKDGPSSILRRMVKEFHRRFQKEWIEEAKSKNLTVHQIVTLASLVEKEAVKDEERPVIAGVFYNRLRIGMPLQSDPTAVYDMENFKGPIGKNHLERNSPYNTYIIKGLPPGPICNPGIASIKAALFPEDVSYLYFVADRKGYHRFSKTYEEHLNAIKEINNLKEKEHF